MAKKYKVLANEVVFCDKFNKTHRYKKDEIINATDMQLVVTHALLKHKKIELVKEEASNATKSNQVSKNNK